MGKHTPTGHASERTVADLTAEHRAAGMRRHPAGRRTMARALVTLTAAGLIATGTAGAASADTNPASTAAHTCLTHPDLPQCQEAPAPRPDYADVDPSVLQNGGQLTFVQKVEGLVKELINAL